MNPRIGKRSTTSDLKKQPQAKVVDFIIQNTKKSITLKQEYLYLEDVKTALNIHHLEVNIRLKRWMIQQLQNVNNKIQFIETIEQSIENDRHHLQKKFQIKV